MNKTPYGVSTNKVGAITVHNYRLRVIFNSNLDNKLVALGHSLRNQFHGSYKSNMTFKSAVKRYQTHDFSFIDTRAFNIFCNTVNMVLLEDKVKKINQKFGHVADVMVVPNASSASDHYQPEYEGIQL